MLISCPRLKCQERDCSALSISSHSRRPSAPIKPLLSGFAVPWEALWTPRTTPSGMFSLADVPRIRKPQFAILLENKPGYRVIWCQKLEASKAGFYEKIRKVLMRRKLEFTRSLGLALRKPTAAVLKSSGCSVAECWSGSNGCDEKVKTSHRNYHMIWDSGANLSGWSCIILFQGAVSGCVVTPLSLAQFPWCLLQKTESQTSVPTV